MPSDRIEAAAQLLGLPPDASADAARSEFLRRLASVEFAPAPASCAALAILDERSAPAAALHCGQVESSVCESAIRAEIEVFASSFWMIPPDQRHQRWQQLLDKTEGLPALQKRIKALRAGLPVEKERYGGLQGAAAEITSVIFESYTLARPRKAGLRRTWIENKMESSRSWVREAEGFWKKHPELKRLFPILEEDLKLLSATQRKRRFATWSTWVDSTFLGKNWFIVTFATTALLAALVAVYSKQNPLHRTNFSAGRPAVQPKAQSVQPKGQIADPAMVKMMYEYFKKEHPNYPNGRPPEGYPGEAILASGGLLKIGQPFAKGEPELLDVMPREAK